MFDSDVFPFHNGPQRPRTVPGFLLLQTYGSGRFCPVRSIGKVSKIRPSISSIDRARFESETTFKKHTLVLRRAGFYCTTTSGENIPVTNDTGEENATAPLENMDSQIIYM